MIGSVGLLLAPRSRMTTIVPGFMAALLLFATACSSELPKTDAGVSSTSQEVWYDRATCDNITCGHVDEAIEACNEEWGEESGKDYNLLASCEGDETNSDCWSDCFRNFCQCGSTSGLPDQCDPEDVDQEGVSCECRPPETLDPDAGDPVSHRYWCCDNYEGTQHGWSDTDHCEES